MIFKKTAAVLLSASIAVSCVFMTGCQNETEKPSEKTESSVSSERGYTADEVSEKDIMRLNQIYGSAGCIYLSEKNNIPLKDGYKDKIKAEAKSLISGLDIEVIGTSELAKAICADHVLSLGEKDRLQKEFYTRYNKDAKLFDEYALDKYEGVSDEEKLIMQIASTDAVWIEFNSFGLNDEKYDVKELLADAFNANVSKYNHNDIYNGKWSVTSELENIFYYFLITDSLDMIKYQTIWDVLGPNYLRDLFESNENNTSFNEFSIANISGMLTDIKAKEVLKAGIEPKYNVRDYFKNLGTEEAFMYDKNSDEYYYYEYTLFLDLSQPADLKLSENKFLSENMGAWLEECYNSNHTK